MRKIELFKEELQSYCKDFKVSIKRIDLWDEIVVQINNTFEVEINNYRTNKHKYFKGYDVYLYHIKNNILIDKKLNLKTLEDLLNLFIKYKRELKKGDH